ncbi:unnamed protein product [Paramecium octaurelia]|uniref:Uncharacterized protein n=1 Tax=Paramecium octaurelia TaxID=43137 RepID=A0A8S1S0S6_PAROT|nr:unnamed protein product [Paramecium octaurelia]
MIIKKNSLDISFANSYIDYKGLHFNKQLKQKNENIEIKSKYNRKYVKIILQIQKDLQLAAQNSDFES